MKRKTSKGFIDKASDVSVKVIKFAYVDSTKAGFRAGSGKRSKK